MDIVTGADYRPHYDVDDKHPPRMAVTLWLKSEPGGKPTTLTFLADDGTLDYLSDKLRDAFQDLRTLLHQYVWPELKKEPIPA